MKQFGLIGHPLTHSFSKKYFTEKFEASGLSQTHSYHLFDINKIDHLSDVLVDNPQLLGLNVTIPYKIKIFPFLSEVDPVAKEIGAVNVIKILPDGKLKGYNSDYYGFKKSLLNFAPHCSDLKALVLGHGGASKAVLAVLRHLNIPFEIVSRSLELNTVSYANSRDFMSSHKLIINCSPVGTSPNIEQCPDIDYSQLSQDSYLYDLVYNPVQTLFMKKGESMGAKTCNGYEMLVLQAEKSWKIWNS